MGRSSTSTSTEPVTPAGGGRRDGRDLVGRDAGNQRLLAADLHRVRGAKAHAVNHDWPAGGRQAQRLHRVGVEHPALVGVVGPAVAALIGDAQAHHVVGRWRRPAASFRRWPGRSARRRRRRPAAPTGSKASQTPSAGMAFRLVGAPVSSSATRDHGKGAPAADRKAEPVGLAHLAQPAAPHSAGRPACAARPRLPMASS